MEGARRFSEGGLLTRKAAKDFWGPEVEQLGGRALAILRAKKQLLVKASAKKLTEVHADKVKGACLAMLPYRGTAQYGSQGSQYVLWENIPEDADEDTIAEQVVLFQQQSWNADQSWWPVVLWTFDGPVCADGGKATCIYQLLDEGPLYAWPVEPSEWVVEQPEEQPEEQAEEEAEEEGEEEDA